tara:strand:+ start:1249 stop:1518 length:270 start_codon:yes stop_codon:yes gene_type:complete
LNFIYLIQQFIGVCFSNESLIEIFTIFQKYTCRLMEQHCVGIPIAHLDDRKISGLIVQTDMPTQVQLVYYPRSAPTDMPVAKPEMSTAA